MISKSPEWAYNMHDKAYREPIYALDSPNKFVLYLLLRARMALQMPNEYSLKSSKGVGWPKMAHEGREC